MQIEEIIRTCAHQKVAQAAVSSIGARFYREVEEAADTFGMNVGAFAVFAVKRFADKGDEREMCAVSCAMSRAQEPLLAGLHHILCVTLAARGLSPLSNNVLSHAFAGPARIYAAEVCTRRERFP